MGFDTTSNLSALVSDFSCLGSFRPTCRGNGHRRGACHSSHTIHVLGCKDSDMGTWCVHAAHFNSEWISAIGHAQLVCGFAEDIYFISLFHSFFPNHVFNHVFMITHVLLS